MSSAKCDKQIAELNDNVNRLQCKIVRLERIVEQTVQWKIHKDDGKSSQVSHSSEIQCSGRNEKCFSNRNFMLDTDDEKSQDCIAIELEQPPIEG